MVVRVANMAVELWHEERYVLRERERERENMNKYIRADSVYTKLVES